MDPAIQPTGDPIAARLRGFGPLGLLAILAVLLGDAIFKPLGAILVLAWARRSRTPWREIGFARPKSWIADVAIGLAFGVALKFLLKAVVMPLFFPDPVNHAYHFLVGNTAALPVVIFLMIVQAGFGEETVYRGFFFERLGKLFGSGIAAKAAIVLLTSAVFAMGHYADQGWPGAAQAAMTGVSFGTGFAITGRIWTVMCAHAAYDLAALAIIYLDLEAAVAHLVYP